MVNDSRSEISHLYMTAMMVKMQYTLSIQSSTSPVISFSIPYFRLLPVLPSFPPSVIFLINSQACLPPLAFNLTLLKSQQRSSMMTINHFSGQYFNCDCAHIPCL